MAEYFTRMCKVLGSILSTIRNKHINKKIETYSVKILMEWKEEMGGEEGRKKARTRAY